MAPATPAHDTARSVRKVVEETVHSGQEALKDEAKDAASAASTSTASASPTGKEAVGGGAGEHGDRRPFT